MSILSEPSMIQLRQGTSLYWLKGFSEMSNPNNFLYIHFYIEDKHD